MVITAVSKTAFRGSSPCTPAMTIDNWIKVISLVIDLIKTLLPYGLMGFIFWYFRKELKNLINKGVLKVSAPGFSLETANQQKEKFSAKEKKEIKTLNDELENTKKAQQALEQLQKDTVQARKTFFLGYHFEKTYRLIFPSQMAILVFMSNSNGEMQDLLAKTSFIRTIWAQNFGFTYEQFIGFLINSGLVAYNNDKTKLSLTPLGKTFLEYIKNENMPTKLPANDSTLTTTTTTTTSSET